MLTPRQGLIKLHARKTGAAQKVWEDGFGCCSYFRGSESLFFFVFVSTSWGAVLCAALPRCSSWTLRPESNSGSLGRDLAFLKRQRESVEVRSLTVELLRPLYQKESTNLLCFGTCCLSPRGTPNKRVRSVCRISEHNLCHTFVRPVVYE